MTTELETVSNLPTLIEIVDKLYAMPQADRWEALRRVSRWLYAIRRDIRTQRTHGREHTPHSEQLNNDLVNLIIEVNAVMVGYSLVT